MYLNERKIYMMLKLFHADFRLNKTFCLFSVYILIFMFVLFTAEMSVYSQDQFNYKKYLFKTESSLNIWQQNFDSLYGYVKMNGVDIGSLSGPFSWDWGDGDENDGWFPQEHYYVDLTQNYVVKVIAHYQDGSSDTTEAVVRFQSPVISEIALNETSLVVIPDDMPTLNTRLYAIPGTLSPFDNTDFNLVSRENIEYILSVAAQYQLSYTNSDVLLYENAFQQNLLKDPSTDGLYTLWYTSPVSFAAHQNACNNNILYSSFFHEMGHNFTLNSPAGYYYGGKIDGNANAIFSESMAQIYQHAAGYDILNNYLIYGISEDLMIDIKQSLVTSIKNVRSAYEDYVARGSQFTSWNDPGTAEDETYNTFMTIAYMFCKYSENLNLGYQQPLQGMMHVLQTFDADMLAQYDPEHDTASADTFRATLMVAAMSNGFDMDLRDEFKNLNFPINDDTYFALGGSINPNVFTIASKVVFLTSPKNIFTGGTTDQILIQIQNSFGDPSLLEQDVNIQLSSNSVVGVFSLTQSPFIPVQEITIPAGTHSAEFFYQDNVVGDFKITASENSELGWSATQQNIHVQDPVSTSSDMDPVWSCRGGGIGDDWGRSLCEDNLGNIYVTGKFRNVVVFGSSSGISKGSTDIFLVKYSNDGEFLWAQYMGGSGEDEIYNIACDSENNVILGGIFENEATFGLSKLQSVGMEDMFLVKFAPNGNVDWLKQAGGLYTDGAYGVIADQQDNIYVTGEYGNTANWDNLSLTSSGGSDAFIVKYDKNGNVQWAKSSVGEYWESGFSMATDSYDNVYVIGHFEGAISFDGENLSASSGQGDLDMFLLKYSSSGTLRWAKSAGDYGSDQINGLTIDPNDCPIIAGWFTWSVNWGGSTHYSDNGGRDIYIAKFDTSGNYLWSKSHSTDGDDTAWSLCNDAVGNAYMIGFAGDNGNFGENSVVALQTFISCYNVNGDMLWLQQADGERNNGYSILYSRSGDLRWSGRFQNTIAVGDHQHLSAGGYDCIVASIQPPFIGTVDVTQTIELLQNKLNLISFNVEPEDCAVERLLDDVASLLVVQDDNGNYCIPPYGVNTIQDVDFGNGYQVYYSDQNTEEIINTGQPMSPSSMSHDFTNTKLFMIANPYQTPQDVTTVFASIITFVVVVQDDAGNYWIPQYGVNTIADMQPGKGYQIYVDEACSFTYPDLASSGTVMAKSTEKQLKLQSGKHFIFHETGKSYPVLVVEPNSVLESGDEIGAFDGDLCVGSIQFEGTYPVVIPAWAEIKQAELEGYKTDHPIGLRLYKKNEAREYPLILNFKKADQSKFNSGPMSVCSIEKVGGNIGIPDCFALDPNYPNPFNPSTYIHYQLPEACDVQLVVYNSMGQKVKTLVNNYLEPGYYEIQWQGNNDFDVQVSSGIYLLHIQAGQYSKVRKLMLLK